MGIIRVVGVLIKCDVKDGPEKIRVKLSSITSKNEPLEPKLKMI